MTTFGDQVFQYGGVPVGGAGPLSMPDTPRKSFFVRPGTGSNSNSGRSPDRAFATLQQAQTALTADKGQVVYLISESNTAGSTTNRISGATFTWSTDGTHIQGVASGSIYSSRARISNTADTTDVSPLMAWSANNSSLRNVSIFYGENDAGDLGCFSVTGDRNYFYGCHFAGIGNDTQDAAGAYSLLVTGSENLFENCVIGLDTIARGTAANSEILFNGSGAARNVFRNCLIVTYAEAATHQFITTTATALDRFTIFDNCIFYNPVDSAATNMTEAFDLAAPTSPAGGIILKDCMLVGATEWDAGDTGNLWIVGASGTAATSGIAVEPAV